MKAYALFLTFFMFFVSCDTVNLDFSKKTDIDDMLGWEKYTSYPEISKKNARSISIEQNSPEKAAAAFIASIMRGDDTYKKLIFPESKKKDAIIHEIKRNYKPVKKWVFRAVISTEKANNNKPFKGRIYLLKKYFGPFEKMIFIEDESGKLDTFILMHQNNGKWYVTAPLGHLFFNPDKR